MDGDGQNIKRIQWVDEVMRRIIIVGGIGCLGIFVFLFVYLFWQVKPLLEGFTWEIREIATFGEIEKLVYWDPRVDESEILAVYPKRIIFQSTLKRELGESPVRSLELDFLEPEELITTAEFDYASERLWVGTSFSHVFILNFVGGSDLFSLESQLHLNAGPVVAIASTSFLDEIVGVAATESALSSQVFEIRDQVETQLLLMDQGVKRYRSFKISEYANKSVQSVYVAGNQQFIGIALDEGELELRSREESGWKLFAGRERVQTFGFGEAGKLFIFRELDTNALKLWEIKGGEIREAALEWALDSESSFLWTQDTRSPASVSVNDTEVSVLNLRLMRRLGRFDIEASVRDIHAHLSNNEIWLLRQNGALAQLRFSGSYLDYPGGESFGVGALDPTGWQPAVASAEVQPGYNLIPLVLGTLKGTVLALCFATPLALLSAIYTSQFARFKFRTWIKPCIELMGSFPSVVLGFLCAFWLTNYIELFFTEIVSFFLILPIVLMALLGVPFSLPGRLSYRVSALSDFVLALSVLGGCALAAFAVGGLIDKGFSMTDSVKGVDGAGLLDWLEVVMSVHYEQRNVLVVAVILGLATVPFMYSLMDDALALVPRHQILASLSLGASRLQMVTNVLLPTALPGLMGALLISTSRCLGETMIFVMVSGNTPVESFSIFEGFKALSATLAIELSEARVGSTLYRTLFLAAWVLLCLTFLANTSAALLRRYYERRYKRMGQLG